MSGCCDLFCRFEVVIVAVSKLMKMKVSERYLSLFSSIVLISFLLPVFLFSESVISVASFLASEL